MSFQEFVSSLSENDKKNFEHYSKIRGAQQYYIIFNALSKIKDNPTYKDVNSFIIFDKAIKDILFTYLAALEESIRNDILLKFDFDSTENLKDKYSYFDNKFPKSKCIRKNNVPYEITEFYKRYALNFGAMVLFIKEFMDNEYDCDKLDIIVNLRNSVMHHSPLLFDFSCNSTSNKTLEQIKVLIEMLPDGYKKGLIDNLIVPNNATKKNINEAYYNCLLFKEN